MFGESGTSATGRTYYYYKCANVKRRKGCNKKTVQKEWLEDLVVRETMKLIQDDVVIDKIVQLVMDVQNQENTTIPLLEKQLREVNKKLDNLMKAIEDGLYTRTTKERLEALEIQKDELTAKIADEKLKKPSFNEDFIRFWLLKFRKFDISQQKQRKALIEIFVNAIFLYDDRILITFNYKDGTQTVRFEDTLTADSAEEKSSDLSSLAGPFLFFVPAADGFFACDRRNDGRNKTQKICRICRISRLKLCISPNKNLENVSILRKNNRLCLQKGYRLVYFMAVKREK